MIMDYRSSGTVGDPALACILTGFAHRKRDVMRSFLATTIPLLVLALAWHVGAATEFTGENASFIGADLVGRPVSLGNDLVLEIDGARGLIRDYTNPPPRPGSGPSRSTSG